MNRRKTLSANFRRREPGPVFHVLFFLFLVTHLLQIGNRIPILGALRIEFVIGSLTFLASIPLIKTLNSRIWKGLLSWSTGLIFLMLIWVIFSPNPSHSWDIFVDKVLKIAILGIATAIATSSINGLYVFLFAYLGSFLKMAQEGVFGILTGSMIWENQGVPRLHGSTDLYRHPNSFAGTQLGSIAFVISLYNCFSKRIRILLASQLVAAGVIVIYSGSRTAYIACIGFVLYSVSRHHKRIKTLFIAGIAGLLVIQFLPQDYVDRFQTITTGQEIEGNSMGTRRQIIEDSIDIFLANPLGLGVDQFRFERQIRFGRGQDTHNLYLQVATDLGVFGLILFLGLIGSMFSSLNFLKHEIESRIHGSSSSPDTLDRRQLKIWQQMRLLSQFASAVKGFLVIRLLLGLFGHDLYDNYWWLAAGLTLGLGANVATLLSHFDQPPHSTDLNK